MWRFEKVQGKEYIFDYVAALVLAFESYEDSGNHTSHEIG